MTVRIGFDVDGVLADFSTAFRQVEIRLFGSDSGVAVEAPEVEAQQQEAAAPHESRRRRDAIWNAIRDTPDFWTTIAPCDPAAVRRIHGLMLRYHCEVFFITRRPSTAGQSVQRQTQRWLQDQGFDLPSVLVVAGPLGAAAAALGLDFYVDDRPQNCLEMVAAARTRTILIAPERDQATADRANRLQISVANSIGEALQAIEIAVAGATAGQGC